MNLDLETPEFYAALEEALEDRARAGAITLELTPVEAWALLGNVQLAVRHPENHAGAADIAKRIGRRIQTAIATEGLLAEVMELSWNERCRQCGCTNETPCIDQRTGEPCHWAGPSICSSCAPPPREPLIIVPGGIW